jgi:spore coat polysaccharide biosynthesis protein SpsF
MAAEKREDARSEVTRLEELWGGEFGDAYIERNRDAGAVREPFWTSLLAQFPVGRALEVGCNTGANLRWLVNRVPDVYGVDVNTTAVADVRKNLPSVNAVHAAGRELPFRDGWFDLAFTMGVLIHQPTESLPLVMAEIVRSSRRYVLCGEYFAEETVEVPYRGHRGALFKRDFGGIYQRLFPELTLRASGFLGRDTGWDDVTWWMFEKQYR